MMIANDSKTLSEPTKLQDAVLNHIKSLVITILDRQHFIGEQWWLSGIIRDLQLNETS